MAFRITARTLLHLGAELISSDGVALYELVKNAFDARSKRVLIEIDRTLKELPESILAVLWDEAVPDTKRVPADLRAEILTEIDMSAARASEFKELLGGAVSMGELRHLVRKANLIIVEDWGEGMSLRACFKSRWWGIEILN